MIEYKAKFRCPECDGISFEEVVTGVTMTSEILGVKRNPLNPMFGDVVECDYGDQRSDGGELDHYECCDCSFVLLGKGEEPITLETDLFGWLKDHNMLEEIP